MEIFEAINTRKTVRKYTNETVNEEDLIKIINSARVAPSATNSQMWEFIAIYNSTIRSDIKKSIEKKYDDILAWPEASDKKEKITTYKNFSTFFTDAPVIIAVIQQPRPSIMENLLEQKGFSREEIQKFRPDSGLLSIGAAIENISLAAHALGYGSCWLTAPLCAYKEIEEILKIQAPNKLVSLISIGVPYDKDLKITPKKELNKILKIIK